MNLLSYTALFATTISLIIAGYVLKFNRRSGTNRAFALIMLGEAFWSFGYVFVYPVRDPEALLFWYRFASIGWIFLPSLWIYFSLSFTESGALSKKWVHAALLVPPLLLSARSWTHILYAKGFRYTEFGNTLVLATGDPWFYAYLLYNLYFAVSVVILVMFYRNTTQRRLKIQTCIILGAKAFHLVLVYFSNIVLQMADIDVPPLGAILSVVSMPFVLYAIMRYRFVTFDHRIIVEELFNHVSDMIFLADHKRRIIEINDAVLLSIKDAEKSIVKKPLENIFIEKDEIADILKTARKTRTRISGRECTLSVNPDTIFPVFVTAAPVYDDLDDFLGFIVIARKMDMIESASKQYGISDREKTVFLMVVQGCDIKQISKKLGIASGTVKNHLHNIYSKTGAKNRMELYHLLFRGE